MSESRFDDVWLPRLGADGARLLRQSGWAWIAAIVFSFGLSFAIASSLAFALVLTAADAVALIVFIRCLIAIASMFSVELAQRIGWYQLPRFNPHTFDNWIARRQSTGR